MKQWKYCLSIVGIIILIISTISASAATVTDEIGDVYHWKYTETEWSWQPSADEKKYLDIISLNYDFDESTLTLTMEVVEAIKDAVSIGYWMYLNSTDINYWSFYSNGEGTAYWSTGFSGGTGEVTAEDNKIIAIFTDVPLEPTDVEFWGFSYEYSDLQDTQTSEWWGDWAPNTYAPWYEEDDDNDDDEPLPGTTGFEALALIAAICIALIIMKRRK